MEHESIKFVGYIGDPDVHREIRRECFARTGVVEQVRYSVVNASLLFFFASPWPDFAETKRRDKAGHFPPGIVLVGLAEGSRFFYAIFLLLPSLVGAALGLRELVRRDTTPNLALAFVALQLFVSLAVAAVFFGDPRLRAPYDPFAFVLAILALTTAMRRLAPNRAT